MRRLRVDAKEIIRDVKGACHHDNFYAMNANFAIIVGITKYEHQSEICAPFQMASISCPMRMISIYIYTTAHFIKVRLRSS